MYKSYKLLWIFLQVISRDSRRDFLKKSFFLDFIKPRRQNFSTFFIFWLFLTIFWIYFFWILSGKKGEISTLFSFLAIFLTYFLVDLRQKSKFSKFLPLKVRTWLVLTFRGRNFENIDFWRISTRKYVKNMAKNCQSLFSLLEEGILKILIFGENPQWNMSKIWWKNEKSAEISPFLPDKIQKKSFFQKISSRASRYYLEEHPGQFTAFTHNL